MADNSMMTPMDDPKAAKKKLADEKKEYRKKLREQRKEQKEKEAEFAERTAEINGDDAGGLATYHHFPYYSDMACYHGSFSKA